MVSIKIYLAIKLRRSFNLNDEFIDTFLQKFIKLVRNYFLKQNHTTSTLSVVSKQFSSAERKRERKRKKMSWEKFTFYILYQALCGGGNKNTAQTEKEVWYTPRCVHQKSFFYCFTTSGSCQNVKITVIRDESKTNFPSLHCI